MDVNRIQFGTPIFWDLGNLLIRAATERDYGGIATVQGMSPEAAQWPVGDYSNYNVLIAIADDVIVGFCAYRQSTDQEAELLNIAVAPAWRRKGIGARLIETLLALTTGDVFLEVAETNSSALGLYEKAGWAALSTRRGYYHHGNINAIVMKRSSC